ncbi:MAG: hypothetical protein KGJ78_13685 [Alphaproteobacteria bacterium]|nr:hypothetical protein [Alphaproteobacteria bacterium]
MSVSALRWWLAGTCAALAGMLAYLALAPLPSWTPAAAAVVGHPLPDVAAKAFIAPPSDAFAVIDSRPIFNPQRTPVAAFTDTLSGGQGGSASVGDLSLVGIILDRGTRLALLKTSSQPLAVALTTGGSIDGWQVVEIGEDHVVMRSNGSDQVLSLSRNHPP